MPAPDEMSESLRAWIENNIPSFLVEVSEFDNFDDGWKMPVIEDYVLVFAVKDWNDGGTGVFAITAKDSAEYRIRGLLEVAFS
jgi:hypothetical protein